MSYMRFNLSVVKSLQLSQERKEANIEMERSKGNFDEGGKQILAFPMNPLGVAHWSFFGTF